MTTTGDAGGAVVASVPVIEVAVEVADATVIGGASWRERAVERSLRDARARAQDRSNRFLTAAEELLTETGSPDFTVQQLVERTRMSLRSFYQHFGSKDELLLVLFQEGLRGAVEGWRELCAEVATPEQKMHVVVEALYGTPTARVPVGAMRSMRGLALYHLQLAEQRPADFAGVLAPLRDLIVEIVDDGVARGGFRTDLEPEVLAVLVLQSLMAATIFYLLHDTLMQVPLEAAQLWAFVRGALLPPGSSLS